MMDDNPMAPGGGAPGMAPAAGGGAAGLMSSLNDQHDRVRAIYGKLAEMVSKSDAVRSELTSLAKLGPMVSMDDIMHSAGKLVGAGIDPQLMAGILADIPQNTGGDALQGWIAMHAQNAAQTEATLMQHAEAARHHLGLSALRLLAGHHFVDKAMAGGPPAGSA